MICVTVSTRICRIVFDQQLVPLTVLEIALSNCSSAGRLSSLLTAVLSSIYNNVNNIPAPLPDIGSHITRILEPSAAQLRTVHPLHINIHTTYYLLKECPTRNSLKSSNQPQKPYLRCDMIPLKLTNPARARAHRPGVPIQVLLYPFSSRLHHSRRAPPPRN